MAGLLGTKRSMTQVFREDGRCVPVTVITAGPCVVVQIKNNAQNGRRAAQMGFGAIREKLVNKPLRGHFKKNSVAPQRFLRDFSLAADEACEVGQVVTVDMFAIGDYIDVVGTSIGKGFQGGMKRWGWSGGPESHGAMHHRRVGSMGTNTTPGRVLRGHHMPGHMGNRRVTVQNLQVISVDTENNTLTVKGAVPGHRGSLLVLTKAKKK